jgi:molecular chaperone GrpE (heat shock protein)
MNVITSIESFNLPEPFNRSVEPIPSSKLNKENLLRETVCHLESERDCLLNTVADLRQLIKRITLQQDQEAARKRKIQKDYIEKIESLELALKTSEANSGRFSRLSEFWKEFVE